VKKIYIIGAVGTGKTTLAKALSKELNIKMYQLDKVVWDDDDGNRKRTDEEVDQIFNKILEEDSWIIEDVGRKKFIEGIKQADMVYYIDLPSFVIYKRCILRWLKQKLGKEEYNYKPTIKGLIQMMKWARQDIESKNEKINRINELSKNYKVIKSNELSEIINNLD
jgi:adenylate kinase family enzyme